MPVWMISKREFATFFATPVGYVFITVFLVLSGVFTFFFGDFYERGQADLLPFFNVNPWLYLFLVPAISMRTWAEERKTGTIELLMTLPVTLGQVVLAKFVAAWAILALTLILTFPLWITVNYLGNPDNGVIVAAYLGSWLMGGAFLAIGMCMSALTKNQVVAFILAIVVSFVFVASGTAMVLDVFELWANSLTIDTIASLSFLTHFAAMAKGVLALNDVIYFLLVIALWLYASLIVIEQKKAE